MATFGGPAGPRTERPEGHRRMAECNFVLAEILPRDGWTPYWPLCGSAADWRTYKTRLAHYCEPCHLYPRPNAPRPPGGDEILFPLYTAKEERERKNEEDEPVGLDRGMGTESAR